MWNMMCDVMPTISEDSISQRSSQFGGDDANFEQLMVSMLDERDKLVDSLKNEQEKTSELEQKVRELEKERDSLNRQLNQNLPQVRPKDIQVWWATKGKGYERLWRQPRLQLGPYCFIDCRPREEEHILEFWCFYDE